MGISITEWRAGIGSFSQPQSASRCKFSKTSVLNAKKHYALYTYCTFPEIKQLSTTNSAAARSSSTDT